MSHYKNWKNQLFSYLNEAPVRLFDFTEDSFPTIDLKALYAAGFSPVDAAEAALSINFFTKAEYKKSSLSPKPSEALR